ncbi:hypothetical protein CCHL11_07684 [Colletotrichum chlorophyti]|uniref:Telomeric single stranded DNA binding POT1/Cdc13 domain-containing protein n=1 Tax=Colletotrichum chlorophyti TaxID=708187 RepID=A0A1Q8RCN1_9PEZI|nr:hypothetical protein CCHL11_07684 [Colletotrichum chlorophyti]
MSGDQQHSQLEAAEGIPIAQLSPEVQDRERRAVRGVITITWPYSIIKKNIAFLLAEPDFRLRRAKGQVRVEFTGSSAKAVADASLGSGDEVTISLEGVQLVADDSQTRVPGTSLEWQLRFKERVLLKAKISDTEDVKLVDVDHPSQPEPEPEPEKLSEPVLNPIKERGKSPEQAATPPRKRPVDESLGLEEYASPAFLKRARVSYGSLFEGSLDIFDEDVGVSVRAKKKAKTGRYSGVWRYASQSPSPEPQPHEGNETDDTSMADEQHATTTPSRPKMVDGACQTVELDKSPPREVQVAAEARRDPSQFWQTPSKSTMIDSGVQSDLLGDTPHGLAPDFTHGFGGPVPGPFHPAFDQSPLGPSFGHDPHPAAAELPYNTESFHEHTSAYPEAGLDNPASNHVQYPSSFLDGQDHQVVVVDGISEPQQVPWGLTSVHYAAPEAQNALPAAEAGTQAVPSDTWDEDRERQVRENHENPEGENAAMKVEEDQLSEDQDGPEEEFTSKTYAETHFEPQNSKTDEALAAQEESSDTSSSESSSEHSDEEAEHEDDDAGGDYDITNYRNLKPRQVPQYDGSTDDMDGEPYRNEDSEGEIQQSSSSVADGESEEENSEIGTPTPRPRTTSVVATPERTEGSQADVTTATIGDELETMSPILMSRVSRSGDSPQSVSQDDSKMLDVDLERELEEEMAANDVEVEKQIPSEVSEDVPKADTQNLSDARAIALKQQASDTSEAAETEPRATQFDTTELKQQTPEITVTNAVNVQPAETRTSQSGTQIESEAEIKSQGSEQTEDIDKVPEADQEKTLTLISDSQVATENQSLEQTPPVLNVPEAQKSETRFPQLDNEAVGETASEAEIKPSDLDQTEAVVDVSEKQRAVADTLQSVSDIDMDSNTSTEIVKGKITTESQDIVVDGGVVKEADGFNQDVQMVDVEKPVADTPSGAQHASDEPPPTEEDLIQSQLETEAEEELTITTVAATQTVEQRSISDTEIKADNDPSEQVVVETLQLTVETTVTGHLNAAPIDQDAMDVDEPAEMAPPSAQQLQSNENSKPVETHTYQASEQVDIMETDAPLPPPGDNQDNESVVSQSLVETQATVKLASRSESEKPENHDASTPGQSQEVPNDEIRQTEAQAASPINEESSQIRGSSAQPSEAPSPLIAEEGSEEVHTAQPSPRRGRGHRRNRSENNDQDPSVKLARASIASRRSTRLSDRTTPEAITRVTRARSHSLVLKSDSPEEDEDTSVQLARAAIKSPSRVHGESKEPKESKGTTEPKGAIEPKGTTEPKAGGDLSPGSIKAQLTKSLRVDVPCAISLKALRNHPGKAVDVLAIATTEPPEAKRAKGGPRGIMLAFNITDHTVAPAQTVAVQIFRSHKAALPVVHPGDAILLRQFNVAVLTGRGFGLRATDASSWAVFERDDSLPQIRGPPVEISKGEMAHAALLKQWYVRLDAKSMARLERANEAAPNVGA